MARNIFAQYLIGSVLVQVKTNASGASRGFGFIRFKNTEVNYRVCELNHAIKGRKVEVKLVSRRTACLFLFVEYKCTYFLFMLFPLAAVNSLNNRRFGYISFVIEGVSLIEGLCCCIIDKIF